MILAIETSTPFLSLALFEGETLRDVREERVGRGHAEKLVPMIAELLDGRVPDGILVSVGPGSFTGIRVGLAAAQGLAIGWGIPAHGFSSLAVLAASVESDGEVTAAMPGGHGELFVQHFARDPLTPLGPPDSLLPEDAAAEARPTIVGPAADMLADSGAAHPADPLARHAMALPEALRTLPLAPLYVRAPDAKPKAA